jgi:hypothetical protein
VICGHCPLCYPDGNKPKVVTRTYVAVDALLSNLDALHADVTLNSRAIEAAKATVVALTGKERAT